MVLMVSLLIFLVVYIFLENILLYTLLNSITARQFNSTVTYSAVTYSAPNSKMSLNV